MLLLESQTDTNWQSIDKILRNRSKKQKIQKTTRGTRTRKPEQIGTNQKPHRTGTRANRNQSEPEPERTRQQAGKPAGPPAVRGPGQRSSQPASLAPKAQVGKPAPTPRQETARESVHETARPAVTAGTAGPTPSGPVIIPPEKPRKVGFQ